MQKACRGAKQVGLKNYAKTFLKRAIMDAQGGRCGICGVSFSPEDNVTFDHVFPWVGREEGVGTGRFCRDNLLVAHQRCNRDKADRPPTAEEMALLKRVNTILITAIPVIAKLHEWPLIRTPPPEGATEAPRNSEVGVAQGDD